MNGDYPFVKDYEQLRRKIVRNEPVWLKIIRLGTQGVRYIFIHTFIGVFFIKVIYAFIYYAYTFKCVLIYFMLI